MSHIDVIRNDWSRGYQEPIARMYSTGTDVKVISFVEHPVVQELDRAKPITTAESPEPITVLDGDKYLEAVARRLSSSSSFSATRVHDELDCPFAAGAAAVPMTVSVSPAPGVPSALEAAAHQ